METVKINTREIICDNIIETRYLECGTVVYFWTGSNKIKVS